jgi:hypothetical protein
MLSVIMLNVIVLRVRHLANFIKACDIKLFYCQYLRKHRALPSNIRRGWKRTH